MEAVFRLILHCDPTRPLKRNEDALAKVLQSLDVPTAGRKHQINLAVRAVGTPVRQRSDHDGRQRDVAATCLGLRGAYPAPSICALTHVEYPRFEIDVMPW